MKYSVEEKSFGTWTVNYFRSFGGAIDYARDCLERGYEAHVYDTWTGDEYDPETGAMAF
ncbi:MAG: hypothetical protein IJT94_10745 [Oscillibacter sp.]|nr:hypothetical protein [Oscillibacter sp.]